MLAEPLLGIAALRLWWNPRRRVKKYLTLFDTIFWHLVSGARGVHIRVKTCQNVSKIIFWHYFLTPAVRCERCASSCLKVSKKTRVKKCFNKRVSKRVKKQKRPKTHWFACLKVSKSVKTCQKVSKSMPTSVSGPTRGLKKLPRTLQTKTKRVKNGSNVSKRVKKYVKCKKT